MLNKSRYSYAIVTLDKVNSIHPYFSKMGDDGWELVSVDSGVAYFKRLRSTTLEEDTSSYIKYLQKELNKYLPEEPVNKSNKPLFVTNKQEESAYLTRAVEEFL